MMKIQRVSALVKLEFKRLLRNPGNLFVMLLLPVALTFIFKSAFGAMIDPLTGENIFQYIVPGLLAYSGLLTIFLVAISFSETRDQGLLKRINTTPLTSSEFIGSHVISNLSIALIQVMIIGVLSFALGFQMNTNIAGITLALLILIVYAMSAIGLGLIVATLAKNAQAAAGLSWLLIVPQQLFGTGQIPLNDVTEIIGRFMPSYYVTDALKLIFNSTTLNDLYIWIDFAIISIISTVIIIIGIQLFKRYGKT